MRYRLCVSVLVLLFGALASGAQRGEGPTPGEQFIGTWAGTWEGAGASGGFELTLEKGKEGTVTGGVSVTGEPAYTATFKTLKFDGKKMIATYDFPPDPNAAEVTLEATFDGNKAGGGWFLADKSGGSQVVSGTWSVTKK